MSSITIGGTNADTWGIVTSVDIEEPKVRTKNITIPGRDGIIDASEVLMGYPVYDTRDVTINLTVYPHSVGQVSYSLEDVIAAVVRHCHGQRKNISYSPISGYHFIGRMAVSVKRQYPTYAEVVIKATCGPYMIKDLQTSKALSAGTLLVSSDMPTQITVEVTTSATFTRGGVSTTLAVGTHTLLPLLKGSETWSVASGTGTVKYWEGRL